ncbi:hypothetical protein JCM11491_000461 [Sporobolomyces phaffii]
MSRHLAQINPNLPPRDSIELLPSPSKQHPKPDRMREWTFPRTASTASPSPPSVSAPAPASTAAAHAPSLTKDLRHRSNFSLAIPSTPELSISVPTSHQQPPHQPSKSYHAHSPSRLNPAVAGTKSRKRVLNDVVYFVVFAGALVLFASSLFGVGYRAPATPARPATGVDVHRVASGSNHVEIAKGFLARGDDDDVPSDVYQSEGDTSHDRGQEWVRASPDDPRLDDAHVHGVHDSAPDAALFPHVDHAHELDDDKYHAPHVENRPRPARLPAPPVAADDDEEQGEDRRPRTHAGHEREHDLLDSGEDGAGEYDEYQIEEEDADDDEHATEGEHDHGSGGNDDEDDRDALVDDSISIARSPNRHARPGHASPEDDADAGEARQASEASLTALEELLLDADEDDEADPLTPEEEEAQHLALQHRRPVGGPAGGDALERLRREREELGRARQRWEARVRDGFGDEDDGDEDDVNDAPWNGSGELRQRQRQRRMAKRIRR